MSAFTLLDLNDDCLLEICLHLSIADVLTLHSLGNGRLCAAAEGRIAQLRHMEISFREPPNYTAPQLQLIGRYLKSLTITVGYSLCADDVLRILQPLCTGAAQRWLVELRLHYVYFDINYVECIAQIAQQLTVLDLSNCQLTDELLQPLLIKCKNLQSLSLYGNYELCGQSLHALNAESLQMLEVELHEKWTFDVVSFHANNPLVGIMAAEKYRDGYRICHTRS